MAYYFNVPSYYRKMGCSILREPLGTDYVIACGSEGKSGRAAALNGLFDEWNELRRGQPIESRASPRYGTVKWLFAEYKRSAPYLEKNSLRSRPDNERMMQFLCDMKTNKDVPIGDCMVAGITPRAADKMYERAIHGPKGLRLRQGEKLVGLCRKAWRVVHRLFPNEFPKDIANPWPGVTLRRRTKMQKPAVTRDQVYAFAWGCIDNGEPEAAAAAVICFEWLQRPENVLGGHITWNDYRGADAPYAIRIFHHKTNEIILHPLEERTSSGLVKFYADAEEILSQLPRRGVSLILREIKDGIGKPYSFSGMHKIVHKMRDQLGLPQTFTLDACRHGGMTELEEAGLTDGQGRALSAHKTQQAYQGYAKRTMERALAATRKRYAHRLANGR